MPSAFRIPRTARKQIIATTPDDQFDLFLTTANRFDTLIGNVQIWRVLVRRQQEPGR
ncbi:hypothetical protein FHS78_002385 [Parvibaculum indicum]|nr:hypothetical protein [Parvibaculum indicum]